MPPRKRAQSAPKTEDPDQSAEPLAEGEPEDAEPDSGDDARKPERSDLQTVDAPCPQCFPNGWPEMAFAVGCEHGSWTRD